ncbi:MAG: hydroxymethylpyrimidine/phosphomethylpyrimidine kinase [Burkholderiales bacterium]
MPPSAVIAAVPPIVLAFAATDPTGGAGIQADLLTLAGLGCHPLSVITAITTQDTAGVEGIYAIDADWVTDQARLVLEDMPVAAFKIGFLGSVENIAAIASIVSDYPDIPLILDPVLASGRGDEMANEDMIEAMIELLIPQTTVITPNSQEARRLCADEDDDDDAADSDAVADKNGDDPTEADSLSLNACASRILEMGCEYVLITGTHENTSKVINTLYSDQGIVRADAWERLPHTYHGSGCTLASAIAATLANGLDVPEAVFEAQEYTWQTLAAGFRPGMGQHLPDRFFWARKMNASEE